MVERLHAYCIMSCIVCTYGVAGKINMKDYGLVLVVGILAILVRFLVLPDSLSPASDQQVPQGHAGSVKHVMQFLIRNRIWLYIGLMVYLVFFARKNSLRQLKESFKFDVASKLHALMLVLGGSCIVVISAYIFSNIK